MRILLVIFILWSLLTGCANTQTQTSATYFSTATPLITVPTPEAVSVTQTLITPVELSPVVEDEDDIFTQKGITLPAPACNSLTQSQTEGPYYKAGSPERNSLVEPGMQGTRLILAGYVLDQNCQPLPHAWLDFWQADSSGEYDNAGYQLRGHQYTDAQGRYYLETILPGLYLSRPIEHIHVKVQPERGEVVTSQLYFPDQPVDGLTVALEDRSDFTVGSFNFVVQQ